MIDTPLGPLGGELEALASTLRRSLVEVHTRGAGAGSGIIWSANGLIVTNAHVARTEHATVVLWDGRELDGIVTAHDPRRDLATIAIDPGGVTLAAAAVGHPTDLRTGDVVVALGHPWGITGAIALGIGLAPGNSGGPLADVRGRVVGVNTLIAGGLGVAVPTTTVARFLEQVEARRASSRPRAA